MSTKPNTDDYDGTELAEDIQHTINAILDQVEFSDPDPTDSAAAGMPDPQMLLSNFLPMLTSRIADRPRETLRAAAILHLELGAIIEEHDGRTPVEVVQE